jgi:hypothetical protein
MLMDEIEKIIIIHGIKKKYQGMSGKKECHSQL